MPDPTPAPRRRTAPWVVAVAAAAVVVAVVAALLLTGVLGDADDDGQAAGSWPGGRSTSSPSGGTTGRTAELSSRPGPLGPTLEATEASLGDFWTDQLPAVYDRPFEPLAGGFQPKTPSSPSYSCGGQRLTYDDVEGNAFYCGTGGDDFIAYDAAALLPQLDERFGTLTPAVVLAHEVGHAVQARAGVEAPSVLMELQADCFAGAWTAFAQDSATDPVSVTDPGLDAAVRALPALRDQPGTPATRPGAHGLAFDRVNAFQTGYDAGARRCATVAQGQVAVTELPFRTVAEARSGGDLPYEDTLRFAVGSLDAYWSAALPSLAPGAGWTSPAATRHPAPPLPDCAGDEGYDPSAVAAFCTDSGAVAWADEPLAALHDSVGDVASAATLAQVWARAGQTEAGLPATGDAALVQQVCLTGAWLAAVAGQEGAAVTLSPGDVDEALVAVLTPLTTDAAGEDSTGPASVGSFERAAAFRAGVLGGLTGC